MDDVRVFGVLKILAVFGAPILLIYLDRRRTRRREAAAMGEDARADSR